jgi:hypothetical protein
MQQQQKSETLEWNILIIKPWTNFLSELISIILKDEITHWLYLQGTPMDFSYFFLQTVAVKAHALFILINCPKDITKCTQ